MRGFTAAKLALGLIALVGAAGCAALFSLEADVKFVGAGGRLRLGYDGRDLKALELPGEGHRADVKFHDKDGNEIPSSGATGVAEGDRVPVPVGATHATISGASAATTCTGCANGSGGGGGGGGGAAELFSSGTGPLALDPTQGAPRQLIGGLAQRAPVSTMTKWAYVYTLGGDVDGSTAWSNVAASFLVRGDLDAARIQARISPILNQGPGAVIPSDVTLSSYVRMDAESLGGRIFVAGKTQALSAIAMSWNGQDKLPSIYPAPNGWQVAEVFVPLTEIQLPTTLASATNALRVTWTTHEDATPREFEEQRWLAAP